MGIEQYQKVAALGNTKDLTHQVLKSIELYMLDCQDHSLDWQTRCEAGISALTLVYEMGNNVRSDLPEKEQEIMIKVCGQLIKNINKCIKGQQDSLEKELAGVKLIRKLTS